MHIAFCLVSLLLLRIKKIIYLFLKNINLERNFFLISDLNIFTLGVPLLCFKALNNISILAAENLYYILSLDKEKVKLNYIETNITESPLASETEDSKKFYE